MKTLQIIQTLAKVGKILSKIVFICCIVGLCGCGVGILALIIGGEAVELGGVTLHSLLQKEADVSLGTVWAAIFVGIFLCIGELFVSKLALNYFTHELEKGTPFDLDGAKELLYLGIHSIWVPIAATIAAEIAQGILCAVADNVKRVKLDNDGNITTGVMLILMSLLCKYGAQLQQEKHDALESNT